MLPLIARPSGSVGYGVLLGCFGAGALAGAFLLPSLRRAASVNKLVSLATVLFALTTFLSGRETSFPFLSIVMFAAGVGWIAIVASLNVSAQTMSPGWLRARTLAVYLLVLQGGMAAGSAVWGAVAERWGIPNAMLVAAAGLLLGLLTVRRFPLHATAICVPAQGTANGTIS
jgi:predicted MFS family arabinose efflux permease